MTIFSLVETMSGRSRHVLYDHHVAERIISPRSRSFTAAGTLRGASAIGLERDCFMSVHIRLP
ncbi:hypothetical protein E0H38_00005 [Rhizobium leguminosarum bv. viciae]|nr:hypothetical protein E0H38_00005 [Rhizobium leguminosarum bv. viciae]